MKAIGPLMWEHRLIERVVALMRRELESLKKDRVNTVFLDAALDFFRTYAEKLHFKKEEDILFAGLAKKGLSPGLSGIMDELVEEHKVLVKKVDTISGLRNGLVTGDKNQLSEMVRPVEEMLELYPSHMEKEDKHFFFPCLDYLSQQEQDEILEAFREFDARLLHEKYQNIVDNMESSPPSAPG